MSTQVPDIEAELKKLWEEDKEAHRIKACLFNLIIYSEDKGQKENFKGFVNSIIERFPCRILHIYREGGEGADFLYVDVSNAISSEGNVTIACDQISIDFRGKDEMKKVSYLIAPHLVSDLPVYLLWGEDPTKENLIFNEIQKYISRLIFISDRVENIEHFSSKMLEDFKSANYDVMDFNWAMISGWRDVVGQVFKSEEKLRQISECSSVGITYNVSQNRCRRPHMPSLYLQGWLAAQLGWDIENVKSDDDIITLKYKNGPIVKLAPGSNKNLPAGSVLSVEVAAKNRTFYSLVRQETRKKVVVHVSTDQVCYLPFSLSLPNLLGGFSFIKELFYESVSSHYFNMLKILSKTGVK